MVEVYVIIGIVVAVSLVILIISRVPFTRKMGNQMKYLKQKVEPLQTKRIYYNYGLSSWVSELESVDTSDYETYFDYADTEKYQKKGRIYSNKTGNYINPKSEFKSKNTLKSKMLRYQEILFQAENEKEIDLLNDELFSKFASVHPWLIEKSSFRQGLVFNFHPNNPLTNVKGSLIAFTKEKNLMYIGCLKKPFSISFDIQKVAEEKKKFVNISEFQDILGDDHFIQSNVPAAFLEIIQDSVVGKKLKEILPFVKRLTIEDEIIFAILNDSAPVNQLIEVILLMQSNSQKIGKFGSKTSLVRCYECGKLFAAGEMTCKKCSAPRPTCVVCLLNIVPSEKEGIIRLPCCGVYAHIHHIEQWLEKNSNCPNCHQDLNRIFRKM